MICGRPARRARQLTKISDLPRGKGQFQTLRLIWFARAQNGGIYHRDWRIENDLQADATFRLGLSELSLAQL